VLKTIFYIFVQLSSSFSSIWVTYSVYVDSCVIKDTGM